MSCLGDRYSEAVPGKKAKNLAFNLHAAVPGACSSRHSFFTNQRCVGLNWVQ